MKQLNNRAIRYFPYIFILFVGLLLFWKFFIYGLYPFPGNFLLGWHEPWRSDYFIDGRIILPNKPVADDVFKQIYPLRTLAIDMMKNLDPPLWNPYNGAGMPLLATLNNGFLDPFNILFFILPYPLAWSLYIIIQPALIGICTYLYCRKIMLGKQASLFAAVVFMLSGFVTVRVIFGMYGLAIAMLPLLLWILESYLRDGFTKRIYILPLAIFALLVSTQPQISLYIIGFASIYFTTRLVTSNAAFNIKIKQGFAVILLSLTGCGLASVQLLPTLELFLLAHVNAKTSSFIIETHLLPLKHLVSMLIPNYFGNPSLYNYWGAGNYIQTITALGLIPIFFAYWSIGKISNKLDVRFFFFVSVIITLALTVDWIGTQKIFSLDLPIFSTGAPSRILFLTTFSLAILAGYGFERWLSTKKLSLLKIIIKVLPFFILTSSILAITFLLYQNGTPCKFGVITSCRLVALRNTILETAVFGLFLLPFLTFLLIQKPRLRQIIPFGVLTLVILIGIYNANKFLPFAKASSFFPPHPMTAALKQHAGYERVFGFGQAALTPNTETQFRLFGPQYYHPLYIGKYRELLEYANNGKHILQLPRGEPHIRSESNPNPQLLKRRNRLLNILGVTHLIFKKEEVVKKEDENIIWEDEKTYITKNQNALPRAYLVTKFEVLSTTEQILATLFDPEFNIGSTVILEEHPFLLSSSLLSETKTQNLVSFKEYSENKVIAQTNSTQDALLVLSDNYYPGWKAYVDNKETKIYRANYTFRAVEIPKGEHIIIFAYKPQSFFSGLLISEVSLLAFGLIVVLRKRIRF